MAPLIFLFLPFYMKNKIYTVPEFLEKRFSSSVRLAFSAFMVLLAVLVKVSISLWASSIVLSQILGWNQTAVIWGIGAFTAVYTMKGGLSAVVYTDAIQTTVLVVAGIMLTVIGLDHVGGIAALHAKLDPSYFSMLRPATDPNLPWPGVIFGVFLMGSFYFAMDQVLVQRVFAAKDLNEGRLGATFCAWLKTLNPIILVGPGLIAAALYPNLAHPDDAYPTLLRNLMPTGFLGLTIAGISAALMGHLSATYNSVATLVTQDYYMRFRPQASPRSQIAVGRVAVAVVFVFGALWAPVIGNFTSLWVYLQSVSAYLMMPFACIFFLAVLWKRINTPGVLTCIGAALVLCPVMMVNNQIGYRLLPFMDTPLLRPWLHGAMVACAFCVSAMVIVSLCTKPTDPQKLVTTTVSGLWRNPSTDLPPPYYEDYRIWFFLVCAITAAAWYILR